MKSCRRLYSILNRILLQAIVPIANLLLSNAPNRPLYLQNKAVSRKGLLKSIHYSYTDRMFAYIATNNISTLKSPHQQVLLPFFKK